jgi:LysR family transcriptional regulator, cys regulon transcriptional activator
MNFQQLRSVRETVRSGFNLTEVAHRLHTSQPGVSRQIRELEDELGIRIFVRSGKRLLGLTEPGRTVLPILERLLLESDNLRRAGADFAQEGNGTLTIATTHAQARYALPMVVRDFRASHPGVVLHIHQGAPQHVGEMLRSGNADIGIATDVLTHFDDLVALPSYHWTYCVVVPPAHDLAKAHAAGEPLALQRIAEHPIITYDSGYTGRAHIDEAFRHEGLAPSFIILAMNADVIKTYVELGMGVGIVATMAHDDERDTGLVSIDAGHLFQPNVTHVAMRRGAYLREYAYGFIELFAPPLNRAAVEAALHAGNGVS